MGLTWEEMGEEEGVEDTNMIVLCYEFSYSNAVCARCVPHDAYKEAMHYPRARVYLYVLVSSRYYDVYITSGGGLWHIQESAGGDYYAGNYKSRARCNVLALVSV